MTCSSQHRQTEPDNVGGRTHSNALTVNVTAGKQSDHRQTSTSLPDQQAALTEQLGRLAKMPTSALRQQWQRLYKTQPPKRMSRDLLLLAVSWKVQARSMGGLSAFERRKLIDLSDKSNQNTASSAIRLKPGTRLVREWHGRVHEVLVLEKGFEWRGCHYRSLTLIASQITGAHWSGPRFFGLKPKPDNFTRTKDRDTVGQDNA